MVSTILHWVLAASLLAALTDGGPAAPALAPEKTRVDFGAVLVGASAARSFRLFSRNGSVSLDGAYLDGGERQSFALDYARRGHVRQLAPGGSITLSVAFSPVRPAVHRSRILARMADGEPQGFPVAVSGTGTYLIDRVGSLRISVRGADRNTPLAFHNVAVGAAAAGEMKIENRGRNFLSVDVLPLPARSGFVITGRDVLRLAPGEARIVSVVFEPKRSGDHLAALRVRTADGRIAGVTLSGFARVSSK